MRIEHGANGRVTAVVYREPQGQEQRQKARIVCVACNAVETARLLLLSESARFPHGLANSSDQVGRNYCRHIDGFIWATFDKPIHFWRGATLAGIMEDETMHEPKRGFAGGYHLEMVALDLPSLPLAGLPARCGAATSLRAWTTIATWPACSSTARTCREPTNRITLDDKVKDAYGLPVAHIHVDEHANDTAMRQHAQHARNGDVRGDRRETRVICAPRPPPRITCARRA